MCAVLSALAVAVDSVEARKSNEPQQRKQLTADSVLPGSSKFLKPKKEVPTVRNTRGTRIVGKK